MKIILEQNFETRPELDKYVLSRFGDDQSKNIEHEIELTAEEADKLSLSGNTKVYGIRIKVK